VSGENVVLLALVLTGGEYASLRLWLRHRATQAAADRKAASAK
jgi:hypothetical protein